VNAWSSTRPARLAVAIATGAVAAVLLGLAVWAQSAPEDAADLTLGSQAPLGADATRWWWWICAVALIVLGAAGLLAGGAQRPGPAVFLATGAMDLAIALGAIALHTAAAGSTAGATPWWLLGAAALGALGVAVAPRPDRRSAEERATSTW
jgi:hypothetical protein